jgi:hypothetical protein
VRHVLGSGRGDVLEPEDLRREQTPAPFTRHVRPRGHCLRARYADIGCTWHTKARITVTIRFPDLRRRDVSNLYPYVAKPLVDGLIDARILPDDDDLHIIGPDMRRDPERGPHRIVISIEDTP